MASESPSIALVTEGPTDRPILMSILGGYLDDPDILFPALQPLLDQTDMARLGRPAGWSGVQQYLGSEEFERAFDSNDFVVVQIDTGASQDYGVPHRDGDRALPPD